MEQEVLHNGATATLSMAEEFQIQTMPDGIGGRVCISQSAGPGFW